MYRWLFLTRWSSRIFPNKNDASSPVYINKGMQLLLWLQQPVDMLYKILFLSISFLFQAWFVVYEKLTLS